VRKVIDSEDREPDVLIGWGFTSDEWKDMINEIMLEEYDTTQYRAIRDENKPKRWRNYVERVASTALMRIDCRNAAPMAQAKLEQCMQAWDDDRKTWRGEGVKRNYAYNQDMMNSVSTLVAFGVCAGFLYYPGNILASQFQDWVAACCGFPIIAFFAVCVWEMFLGAHSTHWFGYRWSIGQEYEEVFQVYESKTIFGYDRVVHQDPEIPSQWTWITCDWDGCEHRLPKWEGLKLNRDGNKCVTCQEMYCGYHFHPRMAACVACSGLVQTVDERVEVGLHWVPNVLDWIDGGASVSEVLVVPKNVDHNVEVSKNPVEEEMRRRGLL